MTNPSPLESIFFAALERHSQAERKAFLDEVCTGDAELRTRVERMLSAQAEAGSFLEHAAFTADASLDVPHITEPPGTLIGPYKLLEQIGEGGMGVVYMADQQSPVRRRVALKIIKSGMDTRQVIARFEAERQALALMDHSNIARVFDAGATESGRPYFVMELVRGVPITEYCDQNHSSIRERLELFVDVCHAVQHAHQKGIIHRDIKPSNVLVTVNDGRAIPKVIDFGVAKATSQPLTEKTMFTAFCGMVGTPLYMSPEQAEMSSLDVDTRSDIYSLGVLLYELLTGTTPFDQQRLRSAAYAELVRIICEEDPPRPSTRLSTADALQSIAANRSVESIKLNRLVRGDLDWVVMKALDKDRNRRYETATGLCLDIERYLKNQAVHACPSSAAYRFRKFTLRHKLGVIASVAILIAIMLGMAGATGGMFWALRERKAAQTSAAHATMQAARSDQVSQFLKDMLKGVAPAVAMGRDTTMLREIVDKTAERVDKDLKGQPEVQTELGLTLGQTYASLQLYKQMATNARRTLLVARANFGEENVAVADALGQLGRALMFLRETDEAELVTRQSIAMQRHSRGPGSVQEADSLCNLADILRRSSTFGTAEKLKLPEAESAVRSGLAIRRKVYGNESDETGWALHVLALVLRDEAKSAESEATIREANAVHQKIHGDRHPYVAAGRKTLGLVLFERGKLAEAEQCYCDALELMEQMDGKGRLSQANLHFDLGNVLYKRNKLAEAESHFRESIAIGTNEIGAEFLDLTGFLAALANVLTEQGKLANARDCAQRAVDLCQRHPDQVTRWQRDSSTSVLRAVNEKLAAGSKNASEAGEQTK